MTKLSYEHIPTALGMAPWYLNRVTGPRGGLRYYTAPGSDFQMQSVTTILGQTVRKPNLERWREKQIRDGVNPNTTAKDAMALGTRLHDVIDQLLSGADPDIDEDLKPAIEAYHGWRQMEGLDYVESEVSVWQEVVSEYLSVAGTVDALFRVPSGAEDGGLVVVDWKTSTSGVYPESCLQLAAYACCLHAMGCNTEISGRIISFDKDPDTKEFTGHCRIAHLPSEALKGWAMAWDGTAALWAALKTEIVWETI